MACGGFTCSKNSLITLNVLYIIIGFILVGVASYGITANYTTSVSIIGGIIACGVFLWLIAFLGLMGAVKHNQVLLFFYMVILFLLFLLQFGIACACLAMTEDQQHQLIKSGWSKSSDETKSQAQNFFGCCGFDKTTQQLYSNDTSGLGHPDCKSIKKCCGKSQDVDCCYGSEICGCSPCFDELQQSISYALKISGGVGLFFSFTEFIGVFLTVRYRNQKDPRANPSAFL